MTTCSLGRELPNRKDFWINQSIRNEGVFIIGVPGAGKTNLALHMLKQSIEQGYAVLLLDPHGDLTNDVLSCMPSSREKNVILLDVEATDFVFGLNMFAVADPTNILHVQQAVSTVMHVFERLFDLGRQAPQMREVLRNCAHVIIANNMTMAEIPKLLTDKHFRYKLFATVTDPQVKTFWRTYEGMTPRDQQQYRASTVNKLDDFLQPVPRLIVGQTKSSINLRTIMDTNKILLVKLSSAMQDVSSLVGVTLISLLLNAAYSRKHTTNRPALHVYVDEFQTFASQDFATLLSEARKYNVCLTLAHQGLDQIDVQNKEASLRSRVKVFFKVGASTADELASYLDNTPEPAGEKLVYDLPGEDQTIAPKKDIIDHLRSGGEHNNPVVNQFAQTTLRLLDARKPPPQTPLYLGTGYVGGRHEDGDVSMAVLNKLFYEAMHGTIGTLPKELLTDFSNRLDIFSESRDQLKAYLLDCITCDIQDAQIAYEGYVQNQLQLYNAMMSRYKTPTPSQWIYWYEQNFAGWHPHPLFGLTQIPEWYYFDLHKLEWEQVPVTLVWQIKPNQEQKFYRPDDLDHVLDIQMQKQQALIDELYAVMHALQQTPIEGGTGIWVPVMKPRIKNLPQRTYNDKKEENATKLKHLKNFTAIVRTTSMEVLLETYPPPRGITGKALQERIQRIEWRNRLDGYVRPRKTVEEEMKKRQI